MARDPKFNKLFSPFKIRNMELKNRLVKTSQWFIYLEQDGSISDRFINFYKSIAKGGVGMIVVEETVFDWSRGCSNNPHPRIDDDRFLPGWKRLTDAIHAEGAKCVLQITHAGPAHNPTIDGVQPVAPSSINPPSEAAFAVARELTIDEIHEIQELWAQAAERAKRAGFDGVEIHLAHYALGNSFLSRRQNKRHDEYGVDSLENRARFGVEIIRRARELCGDDFVLGTRMSAREWGDPLGTTNEEAVEFAKMFEAAGLDYIQSSGYGYGDFAFNFMPTQMFWPEPKPSTQQFRDNISTGAMLPEAEAIRKAVKIPVSNSNGYTWESAAKAINEDRVDLIWMGRNLMVDPASPKKVSEGRMEDVRPCARCLHCLGCLWLNKPIECRWNAFMGREGELGDGQDFEPAPNKKKVLIVGAGPAGLEAARVAGMRGHDVHLYDNGSEIGGLMPLSSFVKETGHDFDTVDPQLKWYRHQLEKLPNVTIKLGTQVNADMVRKMKPDAVVVATGGKMELPYIKGSDKRIVTTTAALKSQAKLALKFLGSKIASKASKLYMPVGQRVVIIGGDLKGAEAAEFLVNRGRDVVILEEGKELWKGMNLHLMLNWMPWVQAKGIPVHSDITYEEITNEGVYYRNSEGSLKFVPADTVMIIEKSKPNTDLYDAIKDDVPEVYLIGDAYDADEGLFAGSVRQGAEVGVKL